MERIQPGECSLSLQSQSLLPQALESTSSLQAYKNISQSYQLTEVFASELATGIEPRMLLYDRPL